MTDEQRAEALKQWNSMSRDITEVAIVNAMLGELPNSASKIIEFNTWVLISCGAISSFVLANIEKLAPYSGAKGIAWGMGFLAASFIAGMVAKIYGTRVSIAKDAGKAIQEEFDKQMQLFKTGEEHRATLATELGITIEKGVNTQRILTDYQAVLPWPMRLAVKRGTRLGKKDPRYLQHYPSTRNFMWLSIFTLLQALFLGGFFLAQFYGVVSTGTVFAQ